MNEIFKDIANIVQEQGDMLDSIEGNLTTTYDRVDGGVTQLTHASRYQVRPTDASTLSSVTRPWRRLPLPAMPIDVLTSHPPFRFC